MNGLNGAGGRGRAGRLRRRSSVYRVNGPAGQGNCLRERVVTEVEARVDLDQVLESFVWRGYHRGWVGKVGLQEFYELGKGSLLAQTDVEGAGGRDGYGALEEQSGCGCWRHWVLSIAGVAQ